MRKLTTLLLAITVVALTSCGSGSKTEVKNDSTAKKDTLVKKDSVKKDTVKLDTAKKIIAPVKK